ncbi:MAG TPA: hypothetical protein VEI50_01765 [Nitrospiraceae bacterium]|nr:hypothetical protein [Nitrospiraceae bacterium]
MAKVMRELGSLFSSPADAIALFHQQWHQAVNPKNFGTNAIPFSL